MIVAGKANGNENFSQNSSISAISQHPKREYNIIAMVDQITLWHQVETTKHRVQAMLGEKVPHEFRSTPVYQTYTAMCGEAFWAYRNNELDEDIVLMLHDAAAKVIELWNTQRGIPHAQNQAN